MGKQWKTACPLNCYDVCGFIVTIDNNQVVRIEGDPDHPITKGNICGRGKMIKDRIYDKSRILYPYKKVDDKFIRISWEQALNEISEKMLQIKKEYGPTAILHSYDYSSSGLLKELDKRFFNYFGGMTETVGSLCWGAGIQAQTYDFGNSLSHAIEDVFNAKTIVVWGRNVTSTNMHLYSFIQEAKSNGTSLIVIDPLKNGIAKKADLHVPIRPGMDGMLAFTLSKIIIDNGWHDKEFIQQHTIGFEHFVKEIQTIDIEYISKEINVDIEMIQKLAYVYTQQKPVMTFLGLGMQRYANGGNTIRAIDALVALSGNIGISGGGVNYANLAVGRSFNWAELLEEEKREAYRTFTRPTQAEEILAANDPPIKMMFITRSNVVTQLPQTARTMEALNKVEIKVVIDMFMTDTAKMADYILPSTFVFEEEDIYYGSMFHRVMRYGPKLIDPPGEAWADLKIWTELAKKLRLEGFEKTIEEYFEIALQSLNDYGIDLKTLKEKQQIELPIPAIPWESKVFATPSGKFEFYSEQAEQEGLPATAKIIYPNDSVQLQPKLKEKYPYHLLTIHPNRSLHSQHQFLLYKKGNKPFVMVSKEIAANRHLKNGDPVSVYNDRGKIEGVVKIQEGYHRDTIMIEEGYWYELGGHVNQLTSNGKSDMGNGSILYDCAVMIEKIG
ncbi:molybdopterin-dependent oxidoreductase [Tepidibacillus sp. HK-1]|uniref:molybdopterin-containing oxidoreductase family protein n=1 Tax=Tepidibacillus sp. HK-1 TaxID=1883407 RepID=UPI0008532A82|nr:molybdopterin-dependent oxidoreductase [Tepidibacillus sp. HK-1]GBF11543.1 putative dimethyl sulfoxide reductase chain YnfF precursor [Tepidibacillus sp. HK-1]